MATGRKPLSPEAMLVYLRRRCYTEDECRIWAGYTDKKHGGYVTWNGRRYTPRRLLLKLMGRRVGKRAVYATCGRNDCMNPEHLRVGAHGDALRNAAKLGAYPTGVQRGLSVAIGRAPTARLGIDKAREVIALRKQGHTHRQIGERYGVAASTVSAALRSWRGLGIDGWGGA